MAGYRYRGSNFDVPKEPLRPASVLDPAKCGTYPNYRQHRRVGVPVCDACRAAGNAYERARGKRKRERKEG